ncbi:hypothetical protein AVEN_107829-1 [Araneus ventricosus]|uniref:Uncharacterized protein n=1 Tax=Araneus ventricosus TaxID=182803 RepID=A0A4Y2JG67_ARAVE|nr:hypothetical protein AVEN_107829-1 [Araneus ventricosus]
MHDLLAQSISASQSLAGRVVNTTGLGNGMQKSRGKYYEVFVDTERRQNAPATRTRGEMIGERYVTAALPSPEIPEGQHPRWCDQLATKKGENLLP